MAYHQQYPNVPPPDYKGPPDQGYPGYYQPPPGQNVAVNQQREDNYEDWFWGCWAALCGFLSFSWLFG